MYRGKNNHRAVSGKSDFDYHQGTSNESEQVFPSVRCRSVTISKLRNQIYL